MTTTFDTLGDLIDCWSENYFWSNIIHSGLGWSIDVNAFHKDLMNKIDFDWMKERMMRHKLGTDDDPSNNTKFTPVKVDSSVETTEKKFALDGKNTLNTYFYLKFSNSLSAWVPKSSLLFFANGIWRDE
ncbi:MAG: hypothetical protein ISR08_01785 [Candidatus Poseidoniaceae archaeon]|nr:hypothetical protein [Candidatus Poseidoniaceae archaeon]